MTTTLYLVRHAQSLPLMHQPEPEWRLSPTGDTQADGLVPLLTALRITRVYTSPYQRCRDTLAPFATRRRLEPQVHEGLRERRIAGEWLPDLRDVWHRSWADFSYMLDGGECSWTCRARIAAAVDEIVARHPGETLALGSHGAAIALFLHFVDATFSIREASALRTPELVKVTHQNGG